MKTLDLVFFDAGGGHRSAANALVEVVKEQERPWNMRMMNLQELLDGMDVFRKVTGIRMQDLYNMMLRRGWTLGSPQLMKAMHSVIRMYHPAQVKMLEAHWRKNQSDLVVSLIPNFNRALFQSMGRTMKKVPLVTILTDLADFPPHFWIEKQPQYFICGTDRAYSQAREMGHPAERVFRTSGMIVSPKFYSAGNVDRAANRKALSLHPDTPTVMIMFGGEGSSRMLEIAEAIDQSDLNVQLIAVAGKNARIEARLRAMPLRVPMHVEGFTRDVPRLMRLSDLFIGKPGPGSISEAIAMGLPVLIERNMWTLPQERYNADWVEEAGVGIALESFRKGVVEAIRKVLDPVDRARFIHCVEAQKNRAIFEIPEILERILNRAV